MNLLNKLSALALVSTFALFVSTNVQAKSCEVSITGDDQLKFNKQEISVSNDCTEVTVTLKHVGKLPVAQMGHNWTLTKTADWKDIAQMGQAAGLNNNYLPVDDSRVIANTEMIGGGESTSVTFNLDKLNSKDDYTFFCSFPGHWAVMNGKFNIEAGTSSS